MLDVVYSKQFKKDYKIIKKRGYDTDKLFDIIFKLRKQEKLPEKYKDHNLLGEYIGFRECHIQPDWLLIYLKENDVLTLTLVATGSHSDLLDM